MAVGRNARAGLPQLYKARHDRVARDRLEILTTLINAPSFDPIFRPNVIVIPRDHPIYGWGCVVDRCERSRSGSSDLCADISGSWQAHGRAELVGPHSSPLQRVWIAQSAPRRCCAAYAPNGQPTIASCGCADCTGTGGIATARPSARKPISPLGWPARIRCPAMAAVS
jgi:hypothetical protein